MMPMHLNKDNEVCKVEFDDETPNKIGVGKFRSMKVSASVVAIRCSLATFTISFSSMPLNLTRDKMTFLNRAM